MADNLNAQVDLISDIEDDTDITGLPNNQQSQPAPVVEPPVVANEDKDIRTLLEEAANLSVDDAGRVRDENGKFAAVPKAGEPAPVVDQQQPPVQQQAPVALPDELAQVVQALPEANREAVQSALVAREAAWQGFATRIEGHVNGYEALLPVLQPRLQAWAVQGVTAPQAVNQLLALSDFATNDPRGFLKWFAGNNNVDLSELDEEVLPVDPQIKALQDKIDALTGTVNGVTSGLQNGQHQQFVNAVKVFETEQDAQGQPLRPHFANVANEMLALVPALRTANPGMSPNQVLQEAYDRAVYANPATRSLVIASGEAKKLADATAATARARTAAQSMTGGAPQDGKIQAHAIPNDTVRGALEASFAQHS